MSNNVSEIAQFEHDGTNAIKTKKISIYGWDGTQPVKIKVDSNGVIQTVAA